MNTELRSEYPPNERISDYPSSALIAASNRYSVEDASQAAAHLQGLPQELPLLRLGPLDALETELHLLAGGRLHVQEEVQQTAHQPRSLGLGDGVEEGPHILQQTPELWVGRTVEERGDRGVGLVKCRKKKQKQSQ